MKIGEIGEQGLIKKISMLTGKCGDHGDVGIGDDAALTAVEPGKWLVTSKDLLVEDVHFLRNSITAVDLGYKSLAVNLSDIAAMGANPRHAYVGLALPRDITVEYVLDFYRGMQALASVHQVSISGGDTVRSPGPLMVSVTVQGEIDREQALLRSGATPGDLLCLTGPLGGSSAGLLLLLHDLDCPEQLRHTALTAHNRPVPRLAEAQFLAASGAVTAAMDTSDGLLKDLSEICDGSNCGAILFADKIPVHAVACDIAPLRQIEPLEMALSGGEDYELLFTVSAARFPALAAAYQQQFGLALYAIGEITRETGMVMVTKDGKRETIEFKGFQHF